jgi:galactitol PTS system EIIA component
MNKLLDKDLIFLNIEATSSTEIFHNLGTVMIQKGYANDNYIEGLINREANFPTGIPAEPVAVAIPHTDASFVKESKIGLMTLQKPVNFTIMGSDSEIGVQVVILLGLADSQHHLKALQTVISLIQEPSFIKQLVSISTQEKAMELLNQKLNLTIEEEVK